MPAADWITAAPSGVRLAVRVTPRAAKSAVVGVTADAAGASHLVVRVRAAPEGGKANAELLRLLARRWRVPARDLAIVSGESARRKVLHLAGPPDRLLAELRAAETAAEREARP